MQVNLCTPESQSASMDGCKGASSSSASPARSPFGALSLSIVKIPATPQSPIYGTRVIQRSHSLELSSEGKPLSPVKSRSSIDLLDGVSSASPTATSQSGQNSPRQGTMASPRTIHSPRGILSPRYGSSRSQTIKTVWLESDSEASCNNTNASCDNGNASCKSQASRVSLRHESEAHHLQQQLHLQQV